MNNTSLNINDLKQLSQLMGESDGKIELPIQSIQQMPKVPKKVTIQSPPVSDSSDQPVLKKPRAPAIKQQTMQTQQMQQMQQEIKAVDDVSNISPNFELMGYVVNKQTVYLLIVLILIGVGIWFMTSQKNETDSKQKKSKKDEPDEEEVNDDNE